HPLVSPCFQNNVVVRNETEIMDGKGNVFRIDRFTDLGDQIVLLDYKTGVVNEVHTVQMQQYLNLVRDLETKPVKGYLIYMAEQIDVLEVA
ncbi:MAG: hypothetical protein Q8T08_03235, partial [Ignavibacteria bacterium]|nr:hypothetical protein [Ignavibacteria bacterium]